MREEKDLGKNKNSFFEKVFSWKNRIVYSRNKDGPVSSLPIKKKGGSGQSILC